MELAALIPGIDTTSNPIPVAEPDLERFGLEDDRVRSPLLLLLRVPNFEGLPVEL